MDFINFQNPDNHFRPAPFWAINDRITSEETARQLVEMRSIGLSGGFFHSRAGLITDYLGEDWFAAMQAALQAARETDGYLWLYDEDLWPSGNAGGRVAALKDEYRAARLTAQLVFPGETPVLEGESILRAAYLVTRDGMRLLSATPISTEDIGAYPDAERLVFVRTYSPKTGWWSGESYANLLDPDAMQQFMRFTHDVYAEHLGEEFGKRIPGIFTDEPQLTTAPDAIPWYEGLPNLYAAWMGRDFWADLPYLFFDGAECRKVRLLMHRTILRQFCEAFSKPIYDWCEQHGFAHTGHYMNEDNLMVQIASHSGSVMAHYRYQQIPGIDHLCRQTEGMLLTLKQVSSAARQLGRKHVLTEIFGVTRHTNTFQDFKWIGDFNLVLGADFFCPHLTLYSARGRRKRDYPPNWNYQQTYWHELRPLNDYFSRVGAATTAGKAHVDILVLHPIESGTAGHRFAVKSTHAMPGEDKSAAWRCDSTLRNTVEAILNAGYDCDLGDEWFIEDYGSVEGDRFRIGEMTYAVVVVPPSQTWRPKTAELLCEFVANGGKIIFLGELPTEVDCDPAVEMWRALAQQGQIVPCAHRQTQEAVMRVAPTSFLLRDAEGNAPVKTYVQHRVDGKQELFFIINSDQKHAQTYTFTLFGGKNNSLVCWDALTGSRSVVPAQAVGDDLRYTFTLPPVGSILLVSGSAEEVIAPAPQAPDLSAGTAIPLTTCWDFARSEGNVLVLDRFSASVDSGQSWWEEDLDFRIRRRLAKHFGVENALSWQPWVAIRKGLFDGKGGAVILRYRFTSAIDAPHAFLVIEDISKGSVTVNSAPVDIASAGWHWDHGFGKVEISGHIRRGENIVDFQMPYNFLTEVEPAYIVGDFGVQLTSPYAAEIIAEPAQISNGTWLTQGYPFYSGSMTYRATIVGPASSARTFLRLLRASGILFKVRLNGAEVGSVLWEPHQIELTEWLRPGENALEIEVIASRQNSLGPLHEKDGDDHMWVGPNAFEAEGDVREEFSLFDYGLLGGAELVTIHE